MIELQIPLVVGHDRLGAPDQLRQLDERVALVDYIGANPEAGVSLGGGLRKVRIPREGGGKSGGYRTIHVFGGADIPIFLVTVFAKNEKDNLTRAEQAAAVALAKALVTTYGDRR